MSSRGESGEDFKKEKKIWGEMSYVFILFSYLREHPELSVGMQTEGIEVNGKLLFNESIISLQHINDFSRYKKANISAYGK